MKSTLSFYGGPLDGEEFVADIPFGHDWIAASLPFEELCPSTLLPKMDVAVYRYAHAFTEEHFAYKFFRYEQR